MFEELLNLVKEQAGDAVVNNDAVPNEHNDAVIQDVANSIHSGLSTEAQGGGLANVMQMFGGQGGDMANNPAVQNIINSATQSIATKYGIDPAQASSIVSSLVPSVMNHFTQKTADPNNSSFDMNSVISSFTGGSSAGGIGGLISGFLK